MHAYDFNFASRVSAVRPGYDLADDALNALRRVEDHLAVAQAAEAEAIAAVTAQEATVKATKATDYVARENAIAPLRKLIPARDRAVATADDLRASFTQHIGALCGAISARRREIGKHREWLAELAAELDQQEARLADFEGRYAPKPEGQA